MPFALSKDGALVGCDGGVFASPADGGPCCEPVPSCSGCQACPTAYYISWTGLQVMSKTWSQFNGYNEVVAAVNVAGPMVLSPGTCNLGVAGLAATMEIVSSTAFGCLVGATANGTIPATVTCLPAGSGLPVRNVVQLAPALLAGTPWSCVFGINPTFIKAMIEKVGPCPDELGPALSYSISHGAWSATYPDCPPIPPPPPTSQGWCIVVPGIVSIT